MRNKTLESLGSSGATTTPGVFTMNLPKHFEYRTTITSYTRGSAEIVLY